MYGRRFWNLRRNSNKKFQLFLARMALQKFRNNGNAKWFRDLESYLKWKNNYAATFSDWSLIGFGFENDLNLTTEEYVRFELAHQELVK